MGSSKLYLFLEVLGGLLRVMTLAVVFCELEWLVCEA